MARKINFPAPGRIKATGQDCTILGEGFEAGIPVYHVRFKVRDRPVAWARSKVIVRRSS